MEMFMVQLESPLRHAPEAPMLSLLMVIVTVL